jgi:hypothetical protein
MKDKKLNLEADKVEMKKSFDEKISTKELELKSVYVKMGIE